MKKFLIALFAFFICFSISSHAVEFSVTNPEQGVSLTSSNEFIVTGTADEGSAVTINHYLADRSDLENIEPKYKLIDSFEIKVDALNIFTGEIILLEGENKLDFKLFKGKNPETGQDEFDVISKTVNYSKDMKQEVKNIVKIIESNKKQTILKK